jgi:ABC-2 type transport system ATP-binding protein
LLVYLTSLRKTVLTLRNVRKKFGSFVAIDDMNLSIAPGMIFGLLGPNGAGKTTLLRMIMGLLAPTSGTITLFDRFSPESREARFKIGYMPQQLAVYQGLTVLENLLFFGRLYGLRGSALSRQADKILKMVELEKKAKEQVSHLSGGMVRRTMLATTLIHQPSLVILDEPTAGVDPALRIRFWKWFQQLSELGTSILITTHHISEASLCQDVVFLREGKLLEQGPPVELMNRYQSKDLEEAFVKATQ